MVSIADELVGAEVGSIVFVRDYVQIYMDKDHAEPLPPGSVADVIVNAYSDPEVITGATRLKKGDAGWRDALCDLIGRTVTRVKVKADRELLVAFGDETALVVSLADADKHGPEAVYVQGPRGWWVY